MIQRIERVSIKMTGKISLDISLPLKLEAKKWLAKSRCISTTLE